MAYQSSKNEHSRNSEHGSQWWTTGQVAHLLGVSTPTVIRWINKGRLTAVRIGNGGRRISGIELVRFLLKNEIQVPEEVLIGGLRHSK
jgi:excisionase family DNA binding protein